MASAPAFIYTSQFASDASSDFFSPLPTSLRHDASTTSIRGTAGAIVFGSSGEGYPELNFRLNATPSAMYEVIIEHAIRGGGWVSCSIESKLLAADGSALLSIYEASVATHLVRQDGSEYEGVVQTVLPASGLSPAGTAFLEITWTLRNIPEGSDRRMEIYSLEVTRLGNNGPRPWFANEPYIGHVLGYVGEEMEVDMADAFDGHVTEYSIASVAIAAQHGTRITLLPNATRELQPPLLVYARNEAGVSSSAAELFLQVDTSPSTLSPALLDPDVDAQLLHQYCEPGEALFAVDVDHLFDGGLPPFTDSLLSAPSFIDMGAPGLIGGRCPGAFGDSDGGGATEEGGGGSDGGSSEGGGSDVDSPSAALFSLAQAVVMRVDSRGDTSQVTLNVTLLHARRERTPTHAPTTGDELRLALKAGSDRIVIQLQPNVLYTDYGNLYGAFGGSAAEPVLVLGAPGAVLDDIKLDNVGHIVFERVTFALSSDATAVYAKKVRGLRLSNCSLEGWTGAVDFDDGSTWMRNETYKYEGVGVRVREATFAVVQSCHLSHFNRHLVAEVNAKALVVDSTTSAEAANDHIFLQQSTAVWLEVRYSTRRSDPILSLSSTAMEPMDPMSRLLRSHA